MNIEQVNALIVQGRVDAHAPVVRDETIRGGVNRLHEAYVLRCYDIHGIATDAEIARQLRKTGKHCKTVRP